MAPPANAPPNSSQWQRKGPARKSRNFSSIDDRHRGPSYAEPSDYFSAPSRSQRSTAYATPLFFDEGDQEVQRPAGSSHRKRNTNTSSGNGNSHRNAGIALTEENLQNLQAACEANLHSTHSDDASDPRFDDPNFLAFMQKTKSRSPEKKTWARRKSKNQDEHPLNLPPEDLRRLSARLARDEKRSPTHLDVDMSDNASSEAQADSGSSPHSQPPTPGDNTPGAFPSSEAQTNGDHSREDTMSPPPPPHRVNTQPKMDPEAAKAAGNKFFKAKDYGRAVVEYTKGEHVPDMDWALDTD